MSDHPITTPTEHAGVKFPPPLIYAAIFLAGLLLQQLIPLPDLPRFLSHITGLIFSAAGAGLCIWSVASFRRAHTSLVPIKPSTSLVSFGPYRFVRNPMYLGLLLLYVGLGLWLQVLWVLILAPVLVAVIQTQVIAKEEQYLERKFGAAYSDYKRLVRRWI